MARAPQLRQSILLVFPVITIIWGLILNHLSGPHFLSRSDPEYVYLLNGMNVALLEFDRIGHVDHPGTPFQLLTGIFIRIVYWISGEGSLIEDVITQPEKYLFWSSFFLSVLTAGLFYWISMLEYRRSKSLTGSLIIPLSFLLFYVIIDLPSRYIPDRLLMMLILLYAGLTVKYLHGSMTIKRYATWSGIVMALGFVTKINFLPFLILPAIVIPGLKGKVRYAITLVVSGALLFLPIHDKINQFWRFAVQISTHDGLYGGGEKQLPDPGIFLRNFGHILRDNPFFILTMGIALTTVILLALNRGELKKHRPGFLVLAGFLLVAAASIIMVAKHYKNYYMIPVLSMNGLVVYLIWMFVEKGRRARLVPIILGTLFLLFFGHALTVIVPGLQWRATVKEQDLLVKSFIDKHTSKKDLLLIEPTWMAGPLIENGLVYGISYIGRRPNFYNDYERVYPHVITYEGPDNPFMYFRELETDAGGIVYGGKDIYILSTPGRNSTLLLNALREKADNLNVSLVTDTVYANEKRQVYLLRTNNNMGWHEKKQVVFGFEQELNQTLYSDDGLEKLTGSSYVLSNDKVTNGLKALRLSKEVNTSPHYLLEGVRAGDYIQVSIKRRRGADAKSGNLLLRYTDTETGGMVEQQESKGTGIHSHWEIVRLNHRVSSHPGDGKVSIYYEYNGSQIQDLDDFVIKHLSCEDDLLSNHSTK